MCICLRVYQFNCCYLILELCIALSEPFLNIDDALKVSVKSIT